MLSLEAAAWIERALLTLRGALTGTASVMLQPRDRDNAGFVVDIDSDKFVAQFILWALGEGMFECVVHPIESAGPVLLLAGEGRADLDRAFSAFVACIAAVEVPNTS